MLQSCWMLVAAFFFASMTAFVKFSSADAGTFEIVFYRSLIGLIFITCCMFAKGVPFHTKYPLGHLKRSLLGTISFTMWFSTMGHLPLGTATTLNYTAPLFIAGWLIFSALRHREKAPWNLGGAIAIGFIGVVLVLQPSVNNEQLPYALIGLCAGAMGPIIFFQIKQLGTLREPSLRIVFYFSLVGTIWGLLGCLLFEGGLKMHNSEAWFGLLSLGVCAVLAQLALTRSYAYGNMMLTACFQFATIPIAEIISVLVFKDKLPASALLGMALILVAGCLASILTRLREQKKAATRLASDDAPRAPTPERR